MVHTRALLLSPAFSLLGVIPRALAHGHDDSAKGAMDMAASMNHSTPPAGGMPFANMNASTSSPESYFAYPQLGGLMLAHIVLMTIAWFFILPIGQ